MEKITFLCSVSKNWGTPATLALPFPPLMRVELHYDFVVYMSPNSLIMFVLQVFFRVWCSGG